MRCFILAISVFFILLFSQANAFGGNNSKLLRLSNGLMVYILKDTRFQMVCTRLYVHTGSANESADKAGISHVLEHMVFKGTSHRPKGQVAKDVEANGGYINAATSFDKTWYIADMPKDNWKIGMDVVKDMAFQATLDPKELESEKEVVISELKRGEDSPMQKLFEDMQIATLKNTDYGRPIIGFENSIRSITADDLRNYIKKKYQPQNMFLLVAGDLNIDEVLAYSKKLFGNLKNTEDMPQLESFDLSKPSTEEKVKVRRGPWNKVYLGLSFPAPILNDTRSIDLDMLSYLLDGDATSYFVKKYKYEKQIVDSISVSNMNFSRAGLLGITVELDPDKVLVFWEEFTKDLANLKAEMFELDAIERARLNLEDGMDRMSETLSGLVRLKSMIHVDFGGEDNEKIMREAIKTVNIDRIQTSIDTWFNPNLAKIRVLAPQKIDLPDFEQILQKNWQSSNNISVVDKESGIKGEREVIDLGDGKSLVLIPDTTVPYIAIDIMMKGGNALLLENQQGLAELTARVLTTGCENMNLQDIEKYLSERASAISAKASDRTFAVSLTGPSKFCNDYFDILEKVLNKPTFDNNEVSREIESMKAAIKKRMDVPLRYMFSKINGFLYEKHPYGYDSLGNEKILDSFTQNDLKGFWDKQRDQAVVISVAGSFDKGQLLAFAKKLNSPSQTKLNLPAPIWSKEKRLSINLPGRKQAHLVQIFKTVPVNHPDVPALMALGSVLSGQSGLLFTNLRDKEGLGYTVTAFNRFRIDDGYIAFYIGTTSDKLDKARDGFLKERKNLVNKLISKDILHAGTNRISGEYIRENQSLNDRAGEAATEVLNGFPKQFQKVLLEKACKVSPKEVQEVVKKYLSQEAMYEAILLPQ